MINVFTLTNINTKIVEGKLSKIFMSEVCIKLEALCINRDIRSSPQFRKGWWQWRSQPKIFLGAKLSDFSRITLFCLENASQSTK